MKTFTLSLLLVAFFNLSSFAQFEGKTFKIVSSSTGKCLKAEGKTINADGTKLLLTDCGKSPNFLWKIEQADEGFYKIICVVSGRVLDVDGGKNMAQLWTWWEGENINQQWKIESVNGAYTISSKFNSNMLGTNAADKVQMQVNNGAITQQWRIEESGSSSVFNGTPKMSIMECDGNENSYILDIKGDVYELAGKSSTGTWTKIGERLYSIECTGQRIYGYSTNGDIVIYHGSPGVWTTTGKVPAENTPFNPDNVVQRIKNCAGNENSYAVTNNGVIWEDAGKAGTWTKIGVKCYRIVCKDQRIICNSIDGKRYIYNGAPDAWAPVK
ncbi:MAG: RICIN domain-containing protein [Marinoscillum sp.]